MILDLTFLRWLYSLFVGIDANFRLKHVNISKDERDPGLNHGYAYVVENAAFKKYLQTSEILFLTTRVLVTITMPSNPQVSGVEREPLQVASVRPNVHATT